MNNAEEITISSLQNTRIKQLVALQQKSAERRRQGLFTVEGRRELLHALEAGFKPEALFLCPAIISSDDTQQLLQAVAATGAEVNVVNVAPNVYEKIAYRGGTEGVVAVMHTLEQRLEGLRLSKSPLIVVLESVEKPGNLGAVLRSADAAGADAVIICDPLTDLYNPNLIRSSIGAIFTVPCVACTSDECISFLKQQGISILTAQLQDSKPYYDTDMKRPTAIVMGTESTGLTNQWRRAADAHIRIPMLGRLDSLNVSVSAAILLYEAVRQRQS
ncbi:MAG: RNA methyltransferase [Prevotella sp.]|nr:RNA methyltransferase [Prevotella sp.]